MKIFIIKLSKFEACLRPSPIKLVNLIQQNLRVGYVCIEESFDAPFNVGWEVGGEIPPPVWHQNNAGPIRGFISS